MLLPRFIGSLMTESDIPVYNNYSDSHPPNTPISSTNPRSNNRIKQTTIKTPMTTLKHSTGIKGSLYTTLKPMQVNSHFQSPLHQPSTLHFIKHTIQHLYFIRKQAKLVSSLAFKFKYSLDFPSCLHTLHSILIFISLHPPKRR